jgi:phosphonate transport system permease protein
MPPAAEKPMAPPRRSAGAQAFDILIWGALAALLVLGFRGAEIGRIGVLFSGGENMRRLASEFIRPNFTDWRSYIASMWLTIQMALWGTALAFVIAVPLGLAGARNLTPVWIQQPARRVLDVLRSIPWAWGPSPESWPWRSIPAAFLASSFPRLSKPSSQGRWRPFVRPAPGAWRKSSGA